MCSSDLFAKGEENQWYIDSGCPKHMTSDINKLLSYNALDKEKNVTFWNNSLAVIKGKHSVFSKRKGER